MASSNIATAADYADAMMIARRAKNWLFLLLSVMVLVQIATFFVARTTNYILPASPSMTVTVTVDSTTAPSVRATTRASETEIVPMPAQPNKLLVSSLRYVTALIDFLGIALVIVLGSVLLLITKIMLVGRLIGVAQVTSAFIWCILLGVLLFPWQAFLQNTDFNGDFKIPGVLYTWAELVHPSAGARFATEKLTEAILRWARFVGFPVFSLIMLLVIQAKSSRGLRAALGEGELESTGDMQIS